MSALIFGETSPALYIRDSCCAVCDDPREAHRDVGCVARAGICGCDEWVDPDDDDEDAA